MQRIVRKSKKPRIAPWLFTDIRWVPAFAEDTHCPKCSKLYRTCQAGMCITPYLSIFKIQTKMRLIKSRILYIRNIL